MDPNRPIYDRNEAYGRVLANQAELHHDDFTTDERTLGQGQWAFVLPGHANEADLNFHVTRSTPFTAQELRRRVMLPRGTVGRIPRDELRAMDNHIIWVPAGHVIEATHLGAIAQGLAADDHEAAELVIMPIPNSLRAQVDHEEAAITLSRMPQTGARPASTNFLNLVDAETTLIQVRILLEQLERELAAMTLSQMPELHAIQASKEASDVTKAATILDQIRILCERLGREVAAIKANKQKDQPDECEGQSDEYGDQSDEQAADNSVSGSEDVDPIETTPIKRTPQQIRDLKDHDGIPRLTRDRYEDSEVSFLQAWSRTFGTTYRAADLEDAFRRAFPMHTHTGLVEKQKRLRSEGGRRIHHEVKDDTPEYATAMQQWISVRQPQWELAQRLAPPAPQPVKKPRIKAKSKSVKGSQAAPAPSKPYTIKLTVKPKVPNLKLNDSKRPHQDEDEDEKDGKDGDKGSPTKKKKPDNAPKK